MTISGANRIAALKKFSNSPLQLFYKTGVLKNVAKFPTKHLCWSYLLMHFPAFSMGRFAKVVHGFKPLTVFGERSILGV